MSDISVFGSINIDLIATLENFPSPGQTLKAENFDKLPGGKGANQAIAVGELGGDVSMYGALGNDNYGDILKSSLKESGVKVSEIERKNTDSGLALVLVNKNAENEIVIISGANDKVREEYAREVSGSISRSKVLLLQLETPLAGTKKLLELLPETKEPKVILDPAPAVPLDRLPLQHIDLLTPNERELATISSDSTVDQTIDNILASETSIILKKGKDGAEFIGPNRKFHAPAYDVSSIDTTGAGDTFNGALAIALSKEYGIKKTIKFANAAGALATTGKGAQSSIPTIEQVKKIFEE